MTAMETAPAITTAPIWPRGFTAASVSAGIKPSGAPDMALLRMDAGASAARPA